jgi:3-oxoacyl-[acyl-carrier protein] reductase
MSEVRRILVTGAASGIGAAICRKLADENTHFLVHTRSNKAGLDKTVSYIEKVGGRAEQEFADLSVKGAARRLIHNVIKYYGSLDVLIANAGYANSTLINEVTDTEFEEAHNTIARSFFELTTAAIPFLQKSSTARIIGISAFGPHVWRTKVMPFVATAAAKAAMEVTVNIVAPGFIKKDASAHLAIKPKELTEVCSQIPMGRIGEADEVAAVVGFCASKGSSYLTGQVIHVNGGLV